MNMQKHMRSLAKHIIIEALHTVIPKFKLHNSDWHHEEISVKGQQTFCGYYDLSPFSYSEKQILVHVAQKNANPASDDITLGLYDLDTRDFTPICKTRSWCWQLGARLGWLDRKKQLVIANTQRTNNSGATIWEYRNQAFHKVQEISIPLFDWSAQAGLGSSLNFTRLGHQRPGYGFENVGVSNSHFKAPTDDGVLVVDLNNDTHELVLSLAEAAKITCKPNDAFSYINHQSWNPSGTRLLFFLVNQSEGVRRSHAMVIDPSGENLWLLDQSQFRNVSHYRWVSDSEFILTTTTKHHGFSYFLIKDKGKISDHLRLPAPLIDGHPSLMPDDPKTILTDSYPDRLNVQSLFTFDRCTGSQRTIARFYSPPSFVADRKCDLHPRVSPSGKKICVDTCYTGQRNVSVLSCGW